MKCVYDAFLKLVAARTDSFLQAAVATDLLALIVVHN